jgi:hypothetical protein
MWWKYDGQWKFGAPCVDRVVDKVDLLVNDGQHVAFLLYTLGARGDVLTQYIASTLLVLGQ